MSNNLLNGKSLKKAILIIGGRMEIKDNNILKGISSFHKTYNIVL